MLCACSTADVQASRVGSSAAALVQPRTAREMNTAEYKRE
jgi:hypothetical protein